MHYLNDWSYNSPAYSISWWERRCSPPIFAFCGLMMVVWSKKTLLKWYICHQTTAATLTSSIKKVLVCCILPLNNCCGQAYDGVANMMEHLWGIATQLQSEQPLAIQVHCFAHYLNLCLQYAPEKGDQFEMLWIMSWNSHDWSFTHQSTLVFQ